jgi:hypothetical protein
MCCQKKKRFPPQEDEGKKTMVDETISVPPVVAHLRDPMVLRMIMDARAL